MTAREIRPGVFAVGAIDWDRTLFDALIPLPDGTSYNSYLVIGSEKVALIDTVDPSKKADLLQNLSSLRVKKIDYIISNHAEQDHSGCIATILQMYPESKVVTNKKCKEFLKDMYIIPDGKFIEIENGGNLSLGNKTLHFILTPWVHWPETMLTYLEEDQILFTCDLFGSHFATSDLYVESERAVYPAAKRYYAEIMMPFRKHIERHIEVIEQLEIKLIAPSHGPIHGDPQWIIDSYKNWISDEVKNEVVIAYVSMHDTTKHMAEILADRLMEKLIKVRLFNLMDVDLGMLAMAMVDAATIVVATPAVLAGPHPHAAYAALIINGLKPKVRHIGVVGSYGWGSKMVEGLQGLMPNIQAEYLEPVLLKSHSKELAHASLTRLADEIAGKHAGLPR